MGLGDLTLIIVDNSHHPPPSSHNPGPESAERRAIERGRALAELADRQYGIVSRDQLRDLGLDLGAIDWRVRSGRLRKIHRGVYSLGQRRVGWRGEWLAAVLANGEEAVLSHHSAGALWGILRPRSGPVHVTAKAGHRKRRGIVLHRSQLADEDWGKVDEIPATSVARTLFDLSEELDERGLERAFEEADRLHLLQMRELEMVCRRSPGRRGLRPTQRMIALTCAPTTTRSPLEERFQRFCDAHGIPAPATNVFILDHEVDCLWPGAKLIAELDSWEFHGHRSAFERDRARDPKLMLAGYRTIRITHRRLDREANRLASEILGLLRR